MLKRQLKPISFIDIELFSEAKDPLHNEDLSAYDDTTIVVSDGATDKSGHKYDGKSGGELAALTVVETCMSSKSSGQELVHEVTVNLDDLYRRINPGALKDPSLRFAATMLIARIVGNKILVTQVGDSSFRINGKEVYTNDKVVDSITADTRKKYIEATGDVAGSREFIMPLLKQQHIYQNNPDHPLGYGLIDGTEVPSKYIKSYAFGYGDVGTIELVTDGYYGAFPVDAEIVNYEELHREIERKDPNKCGDFASTKMVDDRTVVIARLASSRNLKH